MGVYLTGGFNAMCTRNSPVTGEFPAQKSSNAENVSIWWRHHVWWIYHINFIVIMSFSWSSHPQVSDPSQSYIYIYILVNNFLPFSVALHQAISHDIWLYVHFQIISPELYIATSLSGMIWSYLDDLLPLGTLSPWDEIMSWWRHQMEAFSSLLAICEGNPPVTGGFPSQRPVTWSFDVFLDLCPDKWLRKQLRYQWSEMPLHSL